MLFTKAHNLSQLHDEILAAFPALKGVVRVEGGVGGVPTVIRLTLPDDIADPGLAALVDAHIPNFMPLAPSPFVTRLTTWVRDPTNPPPTRNVVLDLIHAVIGA